MKKLEVFEKLIEEEIYYTIKRIKRKFKSDFIAFIVYGSYATKEFTLQSDVDCIAIFKKNIKKEFNEWLAKFYHELYEWLKKKKETKILGKKYLPQLFIYPYTLKSFKKALADGDPFFVDIMQFGELYYPYRNDPKNFFRIKPKTSRKKLIKNLDKEIKQLLVPFLKLLIKKCLVVGRRVYFIEEGKHKKKTEISKYFDEKFKIISKNVSLVELNNCLNKDLEKLNLEELSSIISKCNKFLVLTEKLIKRVS